MALLDHAFSYRAVTRVFDDCARNTRVKLISMYVFLTVLNLGAWGLAFAVFYHRPILLGTALLAYTFGLRHAVDADHISAIDNVTRKLMQEHKRPVAVGMFFSLGHSTIVIALSGTIAFTATTVSYSIPNLQHIGGLIGTSISALFLFIIAAMNVLVLVGIVRTFHSVKRGGTFDERTLEEFLAQRGLMGRFFRPLLRVVDSSWKMYPIGVLFGLGFDTATEVGILGMAALEAVKGLPILAIMIFPLLFTAGMCLVDATDGILMLGAYGWAFVKPMRKLYYNMNVTLVSVLVATAVGSLEALSVLVGQMDLKGPFWDAVGRLNGNFGTLGCVIIGIFVVSWGASALLYRVRGFDNLEVTMAVASPPP